MGGGREAGDVGDGDSQDEARGVLTQRSGLRGQTGPEALSGARTTTKGSQQTGGQTEQQAELNNQSEPRTASLLVGTMPQVIWSRVRPISLSA